MALANATLVTWAMTVVMRAPTIALVRANVLLENAFANQHGLALTATSLLAPKIAPAMVSAQKVHASASAMHLAKIAAMLHVPVTALDKACVIHMVSAGVTMDTWATHVRWTTLALPAVVRTENAMLAPASVSSVGLAKLAKRKVALTTAAAMENASMALSANVVLDGLAKAARRKYACPTATSLMASALQASVSVLPHISVLIANRGHARSIAVATVFVTRIQAYANVMKSGRARPVDTHHVSMIVS